MCSYQVDSGIEALLPMMERLELKEKRHQMIKELIVGLRDLYLAGTTTPQDLRCTSTPLEQPTSGNCNGYGVATTLPIGGESGGVQVTAYGKHIHDMTTKSLSVHEHGLAMPGPAPETSPTAEEAMETSPPLTQPMDQPSGNCAGIGVASTLPIGGGEWGSPGNCLWQR